MLEAIFIDVDGTLTGHAQKPLDRQIRKHLETLRSKGARIAIATSHSFDEKLTRRFAKYYAFDFMALENGSVIYVRREAGKYRKLRAYQRQNRHKIMHLRKLEKHFLQDATKVRTVDRLLTCSRFYEIYHLGEMFLRVRFCEASFLIRPLSLSDNILPLIERLQAEARRNGWDIQFVEPGKTFVSIGIENKGNAVTFLAGYLGISLKRTCAIGDADNDMEMLSIVGLPACPADVSRQLRTLVTNKHGIVATESDYHGTRQILEQIVCSIG